MDKLIVEEKGKTLISNDGATILKKIDIVHPAAKILLDVAKSQDDEIGDGTTSVVLFACEVLELVKPLMEEDLHPRIAIKAFRSCAEFLINKIHEFSIYLDPNNKAEFTKMLHKCACTAMNSKLVSQHTDFFSRIVVDAVLHLDQNLHLDMIGLKKVQGGALEESFLVSGVSFKKTFSYAGFEMQPKKYISPKIALLNIELELKSEKENAEIRVSTASEYQAVVDTEWNILYDKLEILYRSGAKIILSKLPIGDVATQFFADRDLFCAGRVTEEDLLRTMKACGGTILTTVTGIRDADLGCCEVFEEKQIGSERFNFFSGCPNGKACTIILRGGSEQFMEETERSLHDAIMVVKRTIQSSKQHSQNKELLGGFVIGGGAIEMELSKELRQWALKSTGKNQILISLFAQALEVIPRQLCQNAGFDATNLLNRLRHDHSKGLKYHGVDIVNEDSIDNNVACVWEPAISKSNSISAAIEAVCLILSIDETMKMPSRG